MIDKDEIEAARKVYEARVKQEMEYAKQQLVGNKTPAEKDACISAAAIQAAHCAKKTSGIPPQALMDQARTLDSALTTINGHTEESRIARTYIVGQIEALNWWIRKVSE